jgi:hypothetical protein
MGYIRIKKDIANTNVQIQGISVKPLPLNTYTCGINNGQITLFNPNAPTEQGTPTKICSNVPYTEFIKSDNTIPISAEDLKADIDLQLNQAATSEDSGYRGLWDASSNTPDLTSLTLAPEVGDFFFVSTNGTYDSVDYEINDRIQYNGFTWDRIKRAEPWDYVNADDSYDVTSLNNRNYVDYFLTANKDITLPTLTPADEGWICTIVNSSTFRLRIFGTTSGSRRLNRGGSLQLLWNGTGFVVLNYISSSTILSFTDFLNSAVNHGNTIYTDANTTVATEDMDGTVLHPYINPQDAVDNANDGDTINLRGTYTDVKIVLPTDKDLYFYSDFGQTTFTFSTFIAANDSFIKQDQSSCFKKFRFENIKFENAHGHAIYIESALEVEIVNCDLSDNGWNKDYGDKLAFIRHYTHTQSNLQAFYASSEVGTGGAIRIKNTPIVSISQGDVNYNKESISLENCGIGGNVFLSRNQLVNNLDSVNIINCENVTAYNMAYIGTANNALNVVGGIENRFALSVFQDNWGSDVVTDGVSNTKFRDNDLTNSNKSAYNVNGTVSNNSAFLIKGIIVRPERKFLLEILDTQIHSTDNNTKGSSYKGIEFDASLNMLGFGQNIINIDDVGFIGFHDQIHLGNVDITNIKVSRGDCRHQNYTGSAIVPALNGDFYELPYSSHVTRVNFPDFSLDGSATTVIIKDRLTNLIVKPYPVNLIHVDVTTMNLMMGDKIQLENMDRANISVNGTLLNLGTDQSTANTLNSMFERTEVGGGDVDPPTPTLTGEIETLVSGTNYNPSYMTLGLPDGNGNQTLISSQTGDNRGDVWSQIPMDQLGEFTQFQTDSAGGGKRFYVGFSRADQLASLGDGSGNGHEGLQWSLAIYEGYNAPWTFYGDQSSYNYSSFFSDKEAFRVHSGILTNKVTWKVGIDANDGRFYVYFWSIIDLEWKYVAKTSYSLVNGDYHAVVRFYTQGGGMYGDFTNYRFPETDPVLTWNYIESPDGVFHYPLFSTTEEAEFADTQEGGTGTYHNHVFVDDTTNTTWYMPDSLMYHDQNASPNGNTLGSFTDIVWNEIPTDVDSNYPPTPFSDQTITINEGDYLNLQIVPTDQTGITTSISANPNFQLINGYLRGTAPEVIGDNVSNPSDSIDIIVTRDNGYSDSNGTLTIVITNLTPPITVPDGFTLTSGNMFDSNTLDNNSVLTLDDTLNVGKRIVVNKSWIEANVLPNITGSLQKAYIGIPSPNANWNNNPDLHIDFDAVMRWEGHSSNAHKSTLADGSDITARSENQVGSATNAYYHYAIQWDGTDLVVMADTDISKLNNTHDYTQMQRYSAYENYAEQSGNLPIVFATKSGGQITISMTGINFIDIPDAPVTILTTWTKAIDFSGSNQYLKQVSTNAAVNALRLTGIGQSASPNTDLTKTSNGTYSRPFATVVVFNTDRNNSNQHIWNSGEGSGSSDDNIYLRHDSTGQLYFGWGRSGSVNECKIGNFPLVQNLWFGVYVASKGQRFNSGNATAQNLADAFDIRVMTELDSFVSVGDNQSTVSNWITTGGNMTRQVLGDFTIGGRGSNRSFHGKVASMVCTTLRRNVSMPSNDEIKMMITDPKKWIQDYKEGQLSRHGNGTGESIFNSSSANHYFACQVWLMGNGTNDALMSNGIRNQINPNDQNWTRLQGNSLVSNDVETINIFGLTN